MECTQSEAAAKEGVCHTRQECLELLAKLDPVKKQAALDFLCDIGRRMPEEDKVKLRQLVQQYGTHDWLWHMFDDDIAKLTSEEKRRGYAAMYNPHFSFGMAIRNALRAAGYGEKELGVHNLDDIYIELLTEAIQRS